MQKKQRVSQSDKILERLSVTMDLPAGAVTGLAHIEAEGNREIIIDGCKGVLEYGDRAICLNTGKLRVRIRGCDLTITALQNGQAIVKGIIDCIEFSS